MSDCQWVACRERLTTKQQHKGNLEKDETVLYLDCHGGYVNSLRLLKPIEQMLLYIRNIKNKCYYI